MTARSDWPPGTRRDGATNVAINAGVLLLTAGLIVQLWSRGGPYFEPPRTIVDHAERLEIARVANPTRTPLLVIPQLARFIPRGAEVTCFRPPLGNYREVDPSFFAAIGQLPRNRVLPPFTARLDTPRPQLVEYVIAIDEPFPHPAYRLIAEVPNGRLYRVER